MWHQAIQDEKDTEEYLLNRIIRQGLGATEITKEESTKLWALKQRGTTAIALSDLVSKRTQKQENEKKAMVAKK
jgi:hypothetical protein